MRKIAGISKAFIEISSIISITIFSSVQFLCGNSAYAAAPNARPFAWEGAQNISIPRLGRVRIIFPSKQSANHNSLSRVQRLAAQVSGTSEIAVASYSIRNTGSVSRELLLHARNPRTARVTYIRITSGAKSSMHVQSVPSTVLGGIACGSDFRNVGSAHVASATHAANWIQTVQSPALTIASGPKLKVAFVADYLYNKRFGSKTEQHLVTMLDQVNLIYARDLGLTITPVLLAREKLTLTALGSSDSSGLLDGFAVLAAKSRYGEADIYHLLTGKDLSDNIIGLANLPGACAPSKATRVSLSQYLNPAVDYMTMAHEIGHNLGADHDTDTSPPTLMYPSLPVDDVSFSNLSKSQIASFRSFSDIQSCLNAAVPARSAVSLKASTDSRGNTSLSISMPTGSDTCSVTIEASQNGKFSGGSKVTLSSLETLSLKVFSNVARRPNRSRSIPIRATSVCGSSTSTATANVSPVGLARSLPETSANAWANYLVNSFK